MSKKKVIKRKRKVHPDRDEEIEEEVEVDDEEDSRIGYPLAPDPLTTPATPQEDALSAYRGSDGKMHPVKDAPLEEQVPPIPATAENKAVIATLEVRYRKSVAQQAEEQRKAAETCPECIKMAPRQCRAHRINLPI